MGLIEQSRYEQMKNEVQDVVDIFMDDTANSEQTVKIIAEIAEVAIAVGGLATVPATEDKAKIGGLILLDIALDKLKSFVVTPGV